MSPSHLAALLGVFGSELQLDRRRLFLFGDSCSSVAESKSESKKNLISKPNTDGEHQHDILKNCSNISKKIFQPGQASGSLFQSQLERGLKDSTDLWSSSSFGGSFPGWHGGKWPGFARSATAKLPLVETLAAQRSVPQSIPLKEPCQSSKAKHKT